MTESHSILGRFAAEIRRRHVGRVAIGYAAVAFVVLQAAEIVLPAFDLPEWSLRAVVVFTFLGFPVALALGWIYDITPSGIERTPDETRGAPEASVVPRLAFLVLTVAVATGTGWWFVRSVRETASAPGGDAPGGTSVVTASAYEPGTPITSLAVLPLDDFSEGGGQDYFAAGMHEALVSALSQLDGLRVISRTTAMQYDRTGKTMPQIADELRVDGVVEGSVLRAEDRIRITVQLIHAPSDTHVWSDSYEAPFENIIVLQGTVSSDIADAMLPELNLDPPTPSNALVAATPEVREEFMKGRYEQSHGTPEGLQRAAEHFENAIAMDSTFAPAFAALSSTLMLLGDMPGVVEVDMDLAEEAAARALELDEESPEALAVLSAMPSPPPGVPATEPAPESERVARAHEIRARVQQDSLDPQRREAWVAQLRGMGGEMAIPIIRKAMEMGRVSHDRQIELAHVLMAAGHTDAAVDVLEGVLEISPDMIAAWSALERAYAIEGDIDEAVDVRMARMVEAEGRSEEDAAALEDALDEMGERGYWSWCRSDLERKLEAGEPVGAADLATTYAALGETELALEWLRRAAERRDPGLLAIRTDPVWDPYRDLAEFRDVARRLRGRPGLSDSGRRDRTPGA